MANPATIDQVTARIDQIAGSGDYDAALAAARRLAEARPQDVRSHLTLTRTLSGAARNDEALATLENAMFLLAASPGAVQLRRALGDVLRRAGRGGDALDVIDRGLASTPGSPPLLAARATTLLEMGRIDEADALVAERFASGGRVFPEFAAIRARIRARQRRHADAAAELIEYLDATELPRVVARSLWASAGAQLEKEGDFDRAMDCYDKANEGARPFDSDRHDANIDAIIEACSADALAAAPRADIDASGLILIVGMPRSGTSLAERVIAAHPDATAAGELNHLLWSSRKLLGAGAAPAPKLDALEQEKISQTAAWYRGEIERLAAPAGRMTDKQPLNALRLWLLPLILPGARVVHCLRDPRDTCLSNYAQQFALPLPFTSSLTAVGRYYRAYRRVMDHWSRTLADPRLATPIHELRYERLTADPETESRRLLEFLGMDWDEAVLRPHEAKVVTWTASRDQVTEPINTTAVARHEKFGDRLEPLLDALGEYASGVDPA